MRAKMRAWMHLTTALLACAGIEAARLRSRSIASCGAPAVGVNITSMDCSTPGGTLSYIFTQSNASLTLGQFRVQGSGAGLCLSVNGTIPDDGMPAVTFDVCDPSMKSPFQLFAWLPERALVSAVNGLCMDLESGVVAPNERLELYSCNHQGNQHWTLNANGTLLSDFGFCVGYC